MSFIIEGIEYLELWRYFIDRAISIKGAIFKTFTWIIDFAAALMDFIFPNLEKTGEPQTMLPVPVTIIMAAVAGFVLCLYALFMLLESSTHKKNNWKYPVKCKEKTPCLEEILLKGKSDRVLIIWQRLYVITILFTAVFWGIIVMLRGKI